MERLDRETQPTRQVSTALAQTASGQNDQNRRKRDFSAANDEHCDAKGSCSGCARRDEPQQHKASTTIGVDAFAPPIGERAPLSKGAAAPEIFEDGLDDGVKSAAPAAKKLKQGPTQFGATPGTAAPALEVPESCDPGGSLDNYCGRRGQDEMDVVESKGPPPQASSEIEAFPHQAVLDGMEGRADCKIVSLPQQLNIVPQIIYSLQSLLDSYNRETLDLTSHDVISAVEASRNVCSILLLDPEARAPLVGSLDKPLRLAQVLRHITVLVDRTLHEVSDYLEEEEPRGRLATLDNTSPGGSCASPYEQLRLLNEFLQEITRVSPQSTMQKKSGLLDVLCVLQARAASRTVPPTTTTYNLVEKPSSTEPVAAKPSSSTVAVLRSAPYTTMEPLRPPLPPVPPTSSSLDATLPSTESVAPSSSLTNNVNPTSITAVSTKAYRSPGVLEALLRSAGFRAGRNNSLDATAMVVDQKSSAPDPQDLAELLEKYSFDVPDGSNVLVKDDLSVGTVVYGRDIGKSKLSKLLRVVKVPKKGQFIISKDSTGGDLSIRPSQLRWPSQADTDRFPSPDEPWTTEPLLATPPPPISLPPDDIITKVVDGTRQLLSARDIRMNNFTDTDRRRLQIPVETLSDALDRLPIVLFLLDGLLASISEDRVRTISQRSMKQFNSEVHSLVLLGSAPRLLKEWAKTPERVRPPFLTTPVAQASNDVITEPRNRKKTELFANDPNSQKSSYSAKFAARTATELSCAECGMEFVFSGDERRYKCTKDYCENVLCAECARSTGGYFSDSFMCRACKSSEPIDILKSTQGGGSLVHGNVATLRFADRIKLAYGEDYERLCQALGPTFGSKAFYELEVDIGVYQRQASCRRFTKSTRGSSIILGGLKDASVFGLYDVFYDEHRMPNETPLKVAERMTAEVHPGFEVIVELIKWGFLDYLDGEDGGFVGGQRLRTLRDVHNVSQRSMPTVADVLALTYQECLKRRDDPTWPTPELDRMHCEYGAEEMERLAVPGSDVPPARQPAQGPGSRNHASETPAAIVADRADRAVRERATLEFLLAFKAGRHHAPALQVVDGLRRVSGWLSIACADCSLGVDQHIKQQTPLYLAAVRIRELAGETETRGPVINGPLRLFLDTGVGDGSDLDTLRGRWNVLMGCAWRARYRETPTSEYKYVQLQSTWSEFDPAARNADPEPLPAPDARAPRSRK